LKGERAPLTEGIDGETEAMLKNVSRARLLGAWFEAVAVFVAACWASGIAISVGNTVLGSVVSLVPPVVLLFVWRAGASAVTVTGLLYSANGSVKEGRT
jgi:hypothetical protein